MIEGALEAYAVEETSKTGLLEVDFCRSEI